jgi:hypothetical protein
MTGDAMPEDEIKKEELKEESKKEETKTVFIQPHNSVMNWTWKFVTGDFKEE